MMRTFDKNTMDVLEYFKIINILKGLCLTPYGSELANRIAPSFDADSIRTRLKEVSEMKDIIRFRTAFPLSRIEDVSLLIIKAKTQGMILEPKAFLKIKDLIEVSIDLHDYNREERENFSLIDEYLVEIHPFPDIRTAIAKTVDRDGEILDSASGKLKQVRRDIQSIRVRIQARLMSILGNRTKSPGWQDDTVTMREGRYVIPAIAGQFNQNSGIIHDRSQSGATLYVEPNEVIEFNNKLGLYMQEERLEIDRILRELTNMVGAVADRLFCNCGLIGILDIIHASANMSLKTDGTNPFIKGQSSINIKKARHPLLLYYTQNKNEIVSNDFLLNDERQAVIITGPNTGGKTVALKTVGLLVLMLQSGLHIPVDDNSEIGLFQNVFADIGDEQSIELSLSTFSSHIRKIIAAVNSADRNSLVLFDEIGAGTDPKEGAALAESIILKLMELGAKMIVTTHYSQLKTLPMTNPEIENASFEFDRKSLKPTYRLFTGIPGASYAVEIAERLGMSRDITSRASKLVGQGERSLTGLIESLEKELATLRKDKTELIEKLERTAKLEKQYFEQTEQLNKDVDELKRRRLQEIEDNLNHTRKTVEKMVKDIRESKASPESVKRAHEYLRKGEDELNRLKNKNIPVTKQAESLQPGDMVLVRSLRKEGELVEFLGDKKAKVRVGNIMTTVDFDELKKIRGGLDDTEKAKSSVGLQELSASGPEIHLRGMTVDEATEALDKFLDSAVITGIRQIYVVHGIGTGALRKSLGQFLKKHKAVESIRLGNWNEGGAGVTIVKLK
ncbi:MAG: endonuclease MutS2 [Candidatus Zixiibacteriota bacterium]